MRLASVEKFKYLAGFYEMVKNVQAAVCTVKGGIEIDKYPGRFYVADVLEFVLEYGKRVEKMDDVGKRIMERYAAEFERVRDLTTPSQKPLYQMTLEEFERVMGI